ncbi:hypothetical protein ACWD0Z_02985 [Streptomyces sp. NPDC003007]
MTPLAHDGCRDEIAHRVGLSRSGVIPGTDLSGTMPACPACPG